MTEQDPAKGEAVRQAYAQAAEMKAEGVPGPLIQETIEKNLIEKGFTATAASMIVSNLPGVRQEAEDSPKTGKKNMIIGVALFVFGVLATWITEAMAIKKGGGYYIIAIGPMLGGLGLFVKGFFDYKSEI